MSYLHLCRTFCVFYTENWTFMCVFYGSLDFYVCFCGKLVRGGENLTFRQLEQILLCGDLDFWTFCDDGRSGLSRHFFTLCWLFGHDARNFVRPWADCALLRLKFTSQQISGMSYPNSLCLKLLFLSCAFHYRRF